jgi:ElaB/YqjD/DUF883 family membrane-anchored ribosome-binding protein
MSRANSGNTPEQQGAAAQLKDKATEAVQNVRQMADDAKVAATEKYNELRDTATEYYQSGREKAIEWETQLEDYVREQPVKALLMAAGVGVLLGIIWKRS